MAPSEIRRDAMASTDDIRRASMGTATAAGYATVSQLDSYYRQRSSGDIRYTDYDNYRRNRTARTARPTRPAQSRTTRPNRPTRMPRPARTIVGAGR
jgi:hypothetical protein